MNEFNLKALRIKRDKLIAEEYQVGNLVPDIAEKFGVSLASVRVIANKCGVKRGRKFVMSPRYIEIKDYYLSGASLETVGQKFGITRERVRQILVKCGCYERHHGFASERRALARERKAAVNRYRAEKREKTLERRRLVRAAYEAGETYEALAARFGVVIATIQNDIWCSGGPNKRRSAGVPKRRLTDDDKAKIARRYASGENRFAIAQEYDVSPQYVPMIALKLGAKRNHPLNSQVMA